jgi:carboxymethylenebutenolidase
MGELINCARPDGQALNGYLAEPVLGSAAPGLVVIQEWWGLNDQIKGVADRLPATVRWCRISTAGSWRSRPTRPSI